MIAALDARTRLASLRPWQGTPIAVHQVRALLRLSVDTIWVWSRTPELRAALPHDARVQVRVGADMALDGSDAGPDPFPGAVAATPVNRHPAPAARGVDIRPATVVTYDCFHPVGASPDIDLRRPDTVPYQGWSIQRNVGPDLVVFSEPLCLCPRWNTDYVHSYLILGGLRGLLLDTGTGLGDIVSKARTICPDLLLLHTHGDWDHVGGSGAMDEAYGLGHPQPVPAATLRRQLARRAAAPWRPVEPIGWPLPPPRVTAPPSEIDLGGRRLQVLPAPGHTPDGVAVYDPHSGDLFAGDAMYAGLLYARDRGRFAETARRLRGLSPRRIWGGHGPVPVSQADVNEHGQFVQ